jgi:hypothetical protein
MEPSALQRRIAFGLIVFVLAALGAYLVGPAAHGSGRTGKPPAGPYATPPVTSPAAASPPASAASPGTAGQPDPPGIYQWLPFTQAGLAAAASAAQRFGDAYGTFSYTQDADAYVAPLQPVASAQLIGQIRAAYSVPGVAAARSQARQVSAGTAVIVSIRAFGPTSLTFVVQVTQHLTTTSGRSQDVTGYAITLTGTGSDWQVTDIELASAGNT